MNVRHGENGGRRRVGRCAGWLLGLALGIQPAGAATWFVATNGSDGAAGTLAAPFRTLNFALGQAVSGDVVEARGGVYREAEEVRFRQPGVTLRSRAGEWAAIAAPTNDEANFANAVLVDPDADGTTLSRLEISGGYYYGVMLQTKWDWDEPDRAGACRVTIEDCVIHDTGRDAVKITPNCDDVLIQRCEIRRTGVGPANVAAENAEGIDCVNGDRTIVRDCWIHDVYSTGIYLKGGATDGLVERTRVGPCGGGGILLGFDTSPEYFDLAANPRYYENLRGTVRNCLVRDVGWEGIGLYAASNPVVCNNTLINVCTGRIHAALYFGLTYQDWEPGAGRPPSVNPVIRNNLVAQPAGFADETFEIRHADDLGGLSALSGWPAMDANGYFVAGGGTARFTDRRPGSLLDEGTLAQWQAHSGADAHSQTADPQFVAGSEGALWVASPYVDRGTNAAWMADAADLAGRARIQGARVDVGALESATAGPGSLVIGHAALSTATNPPADRVAWLVQLRWFFTHASVGGNLVTGLNVLHEANPVNYPIRIYAYDGDDGDGAYHGGVATQGTEGAADYRAAADPADVASGYVYECQRGNPGWQNKLTCFSNSVVQSGWRYPRVHVALDKFCWIDPDADPAVYCARMSALEARFPQTLFVYVTMPLTTEGAGSENDQRNAFNRYVRNHCLLSGKWLLDLADIEAWTAAGAQQTYVSGGATNQRMVAAYAQDAGSGDFHLNATGRRRAALGWYALGLALFDVDRDSDGAKDGAELLAGTCPTNAEDVAASLDFSPSSRTHAGAGAADQAIAVTANVDWTATSSAAWLEIASGAAGSGNGTVVYNVDSNSGAFRTGAISISGGGLTRTCTVYQLPGVALPEVAADFDGDGAADAATFRPANGNWGFLYSGGGGATTAFGWSATVPVPADYDGDGTVDLAVYHPAGGKWYVRQSSAGDRVESFGWSATIPLPGDYDGDGRADLAVFYRPAARWYFRYSQSGTDYNLAYGWSAVVPVPADYDGNGAVEIAAYHPASGNWYLSSGGVVHLGGGKALPVPADYDGDGKADCATFTRASGTWQIAYSGGGGLTQAFGWSATLPVPADYDGDGQADLAVYHPAGGKWYVLSSQTGATLVKTLGGSDRQPVLLNSLIHSWFKMN